MWPQLQRLHTAASSIPIWMRCIRLHRWRTRSSHSPHRCSSTCRPGSGCYMCLNRLTWELCAKTRRNSKPPWITYLKMQDETGSVGMSVRRSPTGGNVKMLRSTENCQNWSLVQIIQTPSCYNAAVKPRFVNVAPEGEWKRKKRKEEDEEEGEEGEWRRKTWKKEQEGGRTRRENGGRWRRRMKRKKGDKGGRQRRGERMRKTRKKRKKEWIGRRGMKEEEGGWRRKKEHEGE